MDNVMRVIPMWVISMSVGLGLITLVFEGTWNGIVFAILMTLFVLGIQKFFNSLDGGT